MAEKRFILVVYDISNDKRRTKLHTALLDYGTPVQYSVFECLVTEEEQEHLFKAVERVTRPKVDHVRYYPMCERCLKKVVVTSGKDVLTDTEDVIIVS
jgi:CRISPR-associated protein Cas2